MRPIQRSFSPVVRASCPNELRCSVAMQICAKSRTLNALHPAGRRCLAAVYLVDASSAVDCGVCAPFGRFVRRSLQRDNITFSIAPCARNRQTKTLKTCQSRPTVPMFSVTVSVKLSSTICCWKSVFLSLLNFHRVLSRPLFSDCMNLHLLRNAFVEFGIGI
jgi:hypothetical protein